MSTIEITRVEDVREGDTVTMRDKFGGEYVGPVRRIDAVVTPGTVLGFGPEGSVTLAHSRDSYFLGWRLASYRWTFIRATREVPDLPTEPGSVITNATIRGTEGVTAFLAWNGEWQCDRGTGSGFNWANPEQITAWTPARIVPEDGAS